MGQLELRMLAAAVCNDRRCAIVRRKYGGIWDADFTTAKGLEMRGWLQFRSYHRDPSSGDFIRRSEITEAGETALRGECVADT